MQRSINKKETSVEERRRAIDVCVWAWCVVVFFFASFIVIWVTISHAGQRKGRGSR